MDIEGNEVEAILSRNDAYAKHLKRRAFELRMDRLKEAQKKADSHEEWQRLQTLKIQTEHFYNKYGQTFTMGQTKKYVIS